MVIDSSALVAMLKNEPEAQDLVSAIASDPVRLMSAVTFAETGIVVVSVLGEDGLADLHDIVLRAEIEVVPVTAAGAEAVVAAYRRFGRGHHHAGLNFGDCFAYALAMERDEPLLFKGNDFTLTDVTRCL